MRLEVDILISVCRLSVDVEGEGAVGAAFDVDVQHVDAAIDLLLLGPRDVGMKRVDVGEEGVGVVGVDGDECVVGLAKPEEDRIPMDEGRKSILLEVLHEDVGERA